MLRFFYLCLLRLHPARFRARFAEEMLWIFDQSASTARAPLLADAAASVLRQWVLRSDSDEQPAQARIAAANGVPVFYTCPDETLGATALINGVLASLIVFAVVSFLIGHGGRRSFYQPPLGGMFGSSETNGLPLPGPGAWAAFGPARFGSGNQPATTAGTELKADKESPDNILVKVARFFRHEQAGPPTGPAAAAAGAAQPGTPAGGPRGETLDEHVNEYFQIILVAGALDKDHDRIISAREIAGARAALKRLDTNHDGRLTPEECGQGALPSTADPNFVEHARTGFMRLNPLLAALDTDHNGEISAREMRAASRSLKVLDADGDGRLTAEEILPDPVANQVSLLFRLDANGDGRISKAERSGRFAERYRELLDGADRDHDGFVTTQELTAEVHRRADLNKDGVVTQQEMLDALASGALGPAPSEQARKK